MPLLTLDQRHLIDDQIYPTGLPKQFYRLTARSWGSSDVGPGELQAEELLWAAISMFLATVFLPGPTASPESLVLSGPPVIRVLMEGCSRQDRDASAADRGCLRLVCVTDGCHSRGCVLQVPPCKPMEPGLGRMAALGCTDTGRLGLQVWDKISAWPLALVVAGWTFLCPIRRCRPALRVGAACAGVRACCCHECSYPRALPIQKNVGRGGRRGV